jgi:uncharacterized protein
MNARAMARMLPDGRRLHLQDGPIDLIIQADGNPDEVQRSYRAAARRFETVLDELCEELSLLRSEVNAGSALATGVVARRMVRAVSRYSEKHFITPMAAVAGAVAEEILAAMTGAANLSRAYVNNGGDIALHLTDAESYTIGMVEIPDRPSLFGSMEISSASSVRGIATSGWPGRSFSLGIADAVTVLGATAAQADAAATIIANSVDLPGHSAIQRLPANQIAPDSDLGSRLVTRSVGPLSSGEISCALDAGEKVADELLQRGDILAAALCLKSQVRVASGAEYLFANGVSPRSLAHA